MAKPPAAATDQLKPAVHAAPHKPSVLYVMDTTAQPPNVKRSHEMIVDDKGTRKSFTFEQGVPLALEPSIALKFLKHEAFKRTNEKGEPLPFKRLPKQPEELQAGEKLVLADDQTIANYDELSTHALQHRVLEMPGTQRFAGDKPSRPEMIAFLVSAKAKAKATPPELRRREPEVEEYEPDAEIGDEFAEEAA